MEILEADITLAFKNSDEKTFQKIFEDMYKPLCHYANYILNDKDEAEEMVQNAFINAWQHRSEMNYNVSFKSYMYKAVKNSCLNHIKHLKVRELYAADHMATHNEAETINLTLQKELQNAINTAIEGLPEQCKIIFKMSRYQEMKYSQIATELNISPKTVENQMGKALKIMREKLREYLHIIIFLFISSL